MRWFLLFFSLGSAAAQERQVLIAENLAAEGRYQEAEAAYSELLRSQPDAPDILLRRGSLRILLGRYADARADLEIALSAPPSPAALALVHAHLGLLDEIQGGYANAIRHHLIALQLNQESYGPRDPIVGTTWNRLGESYLELGFIPKAGAAFAAAVDILAASPGYEFHLCLAHANAGRTFLEQRRYVEATGSFEQARKSNAAENGCTAVIESGLGRLYYEQRDFSQAEKHFRESIAVGRRIWPGGHAATAGALQGLARTAAARSNFAEARELFHQSLEMDERVLGPTHPDVREVLLDLAGLLRAAHRGREARLIAARIRRDFPASLHSVSIDALARR
jgi:tetratricopeptide (TPR) repeat protein